jgi:UDP-2,3-diacylglucosamine pyrophosphatase LpxH
VPVSPTTTLDAGTAPAPDTATPDTATPDTATPDTATPDTATSDTATPDTATPDTATPDTATPDSATPDTADRPVHLAVAGDVGTGDDVERATADAMDRVEAANPYDALLLLGDNVYPDGNPEDIRTKVLEPFANVLDGTTQLLPVLGNHDNDSGYADEQLAALGMPARWYSTVIDDVLVLSLDSNHPDDAEQLRWLEATLADSTQTWKIAEMHHPPYSAGVHGSSKRVRAAFVPLFRRYGVQLVLAGHDHDYQRSHVIDGITYVVSGAAAKLRSAGTADFTEVSTSTYHFLDITVWPDHLDLAAIGQDGAVIDHVTLNPTS